jgi:hypothetical protein
MRRRRIYPDSCLGFTTAGLSSTSSLVLAAELKSASAEASAETSALVLAAERKSTSAEALALVLAAEKKQYEFSCASVPTISKKPSLSKEEGMLRLAKEQEQAAKLKAAEMAKAEEAKTREEAAKEAAKVAAEAKKLVKQQEHLRRIAKAEKRQAAKRIAHSPCEEVIAEGLAKTLSVFPCFAIIALLLNLMFPGHAPVIKAIYKRTITIALSSGLVYENRFESEQKRKLGNLGEKIRGMFPPDPASAKTTVLDCQVFTVENFQCMICEELGIGLSGLCNLTLRGLMNEIIDNFIHFIRLNRSQE